jgi:hypothetical protein
MNPEALLDRLFAVSPQVRYAAVRRGPDLHMRQREGVVDERRPENVPRRAPGRHRHRASVPSVAVIAGMTMRHPPADVIGQAHVAVVAARQGGHIQRLPPVVVCTGVRPAWVIADMESPRAIEQSRRGTQRWRIGPAAARQVGEYDGPGHQRRGDDADDHCALCWQHVE